jgi:predicted Fe-Mo cluster-binding NifX family protein
MTMEKIAICHLNGRVAPRYDHTDEFLLVTIRNGKEIVERKIAGIVTAQSSDLAEQLHMLNITVLICGGVRLSLQNTLKKSGILLIDNVIGNVDDVLTWYMEGRLSAGDVVS